MAAPRYYLQGASVETYNKYALDIEGDWVRHIFIQLAIFWFLFDLSISHHRTMMNLLYDVCNFLMWYLFCLKVRDREPKEFKIWKLAHNANT